MAPARPAGPVWWVHTRPSKKRSIGWPDGSGYQAAGATGGGPHAGGRPRRRGRPSTTAAAYRWSPSELAAPCRRGSRATMARCSRCGRRPCRSIGTWRVRRSAATPTSTLPSSAAASRACGPRCRWRSAIPALRIAVLERHTVGFGASGRNGGWCSALLTTSLTALAAEHGRDAAVAAQRAMHAAVDEVGRFAAERNRRRRVPQGRHRHVRPDPGPARPAGRRRRRGRGPSGSGRPRRAVDDGRRARRRRPATRDAGRASPRRTAPPSIPLRLVHAIAGAAVTARGAHCTPARRSSPSSRAGSPRRRAWCGPTSSSSPPRPGRRRIPTATATWPPSTR